MATTGENRGKVIAHSPDLLLASASFYVNEKGRQCVLESGTKNVHAFINGFLTYESQQYLVTCCRREAWYSPFGSGAFIDVNTDTDIPDIGDWVVRCTMLHGRPQVLYGTFNDYTGEGAAKWLKIYQTWQSQVS